LYNFSKALIEKGDNKESKKDILAFLLLIFVVFGIMFIYFLPQNGINIYPLFYLTIPIYALVLGYIIIEKNAFTSVLTVDIIIAAILSFLASFLIFPDVELGIIAKSVIFTLISFVSFLLIRNMNKISGQKTEFERLIKERTKELEEKTVYLNEAKEKLEESNAILEITVKARTRELQELNENLEAEIQKRTKELSNKTKELEEKIEELQQFSNIFINRENKMVELKEEIKKLKEKPIE
jgi:membrane protein implicated in regulation of membrane protease activity